ncbi:MAG: MFS transporter [Hydrogenophaga sp.]|uniref:MFS transporter n=1 Tax=Hydrogenophaga sp. TaxID=1904254 RepID=UPI002721780F|nr:MFS transporter [Hydrogenophaga sp.]MDO9148786.1 MFS transporter [Hydrogenophaga sp.]MDO9603784.1 MFS transporter [Hydrogenophaga sp.]
MSEPAATPGRINLGIVSIVCFNFASYVCNGLPLAVLPGYVLSDLDLGPVFAGLVIGVQYMATLLSRPLGGQLADRWGSKRVVLYGLGGLVLSGVLTSIAIFLHAHLWLGTGLLLAGRVVLGVSSALVSTPCCTWAIGLYGTQNTARVMSWNGIAAYGGTALGAPLGVLVRDGTHLIGIGLCTALLGFAALLFASTRPAATIVSGVRQPFRHVFLAVMPNGVAMACSSVGFGSLTAFIALYFNSLGWDNAAYCLSSFGVAFIVARLVSPNLLPRFGGYRVVAACMLVQSLGLLLIWQAPSPELVMLGAGLTGIGVSWVYPGLGVETLERTPPANRGAALSALSLFFDLAVGLAGPLMGLIASGWGYAEVFLVSGLLGIAGFLLVMQLRRTVHRSSA